MCILPGCIVTVYIALHVLIWTVLFWMLHYLKNAVLNHEYMMLAVVLRILLCHILWYGTQSFQCAVKWIAIIFSLQPWLNISIIFSFAVLALFSLDNILWHLQASKNCSLSLQLGRKHLRVGILERSSEWVYERINEWMNKGMNVEIQDMLVINF